MKDEVSCVLSRIAREEDEVRKSICEVNDIVQKIASLTRELEEERAANARFFTNEVRDREKVF